MGMILPHLFGLIKLHQTSQISTMYFFYTPQQIERGHASAIGKQCKNLHNPYYQACKAKSMAPVPTPPFPLC